MDNGNFNKMNPETDFTDQNFSIDLDQDGITDVNISQEPGVLNINIPGAPEENIIGVVGVDLNGDGVADTLGVDFDNDGSIDAYGTGVDFDGDGAADALGVDLDGDGIVDQYLFPDYF